MVVFAVDLPSSRASSGIRLYESDSDLFVRGEETAEAVVTPAGLVPRSLSMDLECVRCEAVAAHDGIVIACLGMGINCCQRDGTYYGDFKQTQTLFPGLQNNTVCLIRNNHLSYLALPLPAGQMVQAVGISPDGLTAVALASNLLLSDNMWVEHSEPPPYEPYQCYVVLFDL